MEKLTNEQLVELYLQEQDEYKKEELLNQLFKANEKFVHYIAKKYTHPRLNYDDFTELATIGMVKALKSFDLSKGNKFITYASMLMTNEILMELRKPEYKKDLMSMDEPIGGTDDKLTIADMLSDPNANVEDSFVQSQLINVILSDGKDILDAREYAILTNVLLDEPLTQAELSEKHGISQSYISRLATKAFTKIRQHLAEPQPKPKGKSMINKPKPSIRKRKKMIFEKEPIPMTIVAETTEVTTYAPQTDNEDVTTIEVKGNNLKEKIKYILDNYPDMKRVDTAKLLGVSAPTVYSYISAIKREEKEASGVLVKPSMTSRPTRSIAERARDNAPVIISGSPSSVSLALEGVSQDTISTTLQALISTLNNGGTYNLTLNIEQSTTL